MFVKGTNFQVRVWNALLQIPSGVVTSYGEMAHRLGNARASRAVGAAIGQNEIGFLIPCHRVISAAGHLHGFSGSCDQGGPALAVKRALLQMEGGLKRSEPGSTDIFRYDPMPLVSSMDTCDI